MKFLVGMCVREECAFTQEVMVPSAPLYANEAIIQQLTLITMQAQAQLESRVQSHTHGVGHTVEIRTVMRP